MNKQSKDKVIKLIDMLFNETLSSSEQEKINEELNSLLIDPNWSDYIFWSDDYINEDNSINYDKFFEKISSYLSSEECLRNKKIISLVNMLLKRDFNEMKEMDIVNTLNSLIPDLNWLNYIFVSRCCLNHDGSLNEKVFLEKIFN